MSRAIQRRWSIHFKSGDIRLKCDGSSKQGHDDTRLPFFVTPSVIVDASPAKAEYAAGWWAGIGLNWGYWWVGIMLITAVIDFDKRKEIIGH